MEDKFYEFPKQSHHSSFEIQHSPLNPVAEHACSELVEVSKLFLSRVEASKFYLLSKPYLMRFFQLKLTPYDNPPC